MSVHDDSENTCKTVRIRALRQPKSVNRCKTMPIVLDPAGAAVPKASDRHKTCTVRPTGPRKSADKHRTCTIHPSRSRILPNPVQHGVSDWIPPSSPEIPPGLTRPPTPFGPPTAKIKNHLPDRWGGGRHVLKQVPRTGCKVFAVWRIGRNDRTRTCDLTVPNRALYHLSYIPMRQLVLYHGPKSRVNRTSTGNVVRFSSSARRIYVPALVV